MYSIIRGPDGSVSCIARESDNALIPIDASNKDFQEFQAWNNALPVEDRLSLNAVPDLAYLKHQKRNQLNTWLAAQQAAGYTPPNQAFALRMGSDDQAAFYLLDANMQKLKAAGQATADSPVPIRAADGRTYSVTTAEWDAISVGYAAACFALWGQFAALRDQIEAADSAEDLNAIALEA